MDMLTSICDIHEHLNFCTIISFQASDMFVYYDPVRNKTIGWSCIEENIYYLFVCYL